MRENGVIVLIEFRAVPGKETVAQRELTELVATVVENEPECAGIEILRDRDEATRFVLYERWSSREAYTGPHMRTPHLLAFIAKASDFMAGPPAISFLEQVE